MIFLCKTRYSQIYEPLSLPIVIPDQPVAAPPVPLEPLLPATLADPTGANLTCAMMCSARVLPTVLLQQPGMVQLLQVPRFPQVLFKLFGALQLGATLLSLLAPLFRSQGAGTRPGCRHQWRETLCGEGGGAWPW